MKAQSYLNWSQIYLRNFETAQEYLEFENNARRLYHSEFLPERIPDLFEGWKRTENGDQYEDDEEGGLLMICYTNDKGDCFMDSAGPIMGSQYFADAVGDDHVCTMEPEILNDFIRDCERAGIELNWNTENEDVKRAFGR